MIRGVTNPYRKSLPKYGHAILLWKALKESVTYCPITHTIDMGWNSGLSSGIYTNVFKDRGKIFFRKRGLIKRDIKMREIYHDSKKRNLRTKRLSRYELVD